jgi:hypothetical protein
MKRVVALALPLGVLLAAVVCPPRVAAQTGCCFAGSTPATLEGAHVGAASATEASALAERLGFTWEPAQDEADPAWGHVRFEGGSLAFEPFREAAAGWPLDGRALRPEVVRHFYLLCGRPRPQFTPWGYDPGAHHPNGVTGLAGVIALVPAHARSVEEIGGPDRGAFGRPQLEADLDVNAREARWPGGGFVRVLAPPGADAPAPALADVAPNRWVGLVFETGNLAWTQDWLESHGVPCRRVDRHEDALLVEPRDAGGLVIEFVTRGWRPRA